ncbi:hypothetical protein JTB14_015863 [Gonioctena quinquepunctata]|nr:hypothetical protein JTB14_015863 [Gonioctena quinquepunctata]
MKLKDCLYFRKGKGKCPFGNTCLYLHALPNGKVLDVGPPQPRRRRGEATWALESEAEMLQQILFWINDDQDDEMGVDSEDDEGSEFGLDLDDPCVAMQYYDKDDFRRYMAMDRLMNGSDDEDDFDMIF